MQIRTNAVAGALDGALATGVMSLWMWGAWKLGALGNPPPRRITRFALHRVGAAPRGVGAELVALALHVVFGATAGAMFRSIRRNARRRRSIAVGEGVAFGVFVWAVSYAGWIPALRILPRPSRDRPGRPTSMLTAHAVYGAVLGLRAAGRE